MCSSDLQPLYPLRVELALLLLDANESKTVRDRLIGQKQGELYAKWVEGLRKRAKIVENEHMLSYEVGPAHEAYSPDDF